MMVLICYDGSADAQAAIARAGELMPASDAVVLVIWETVMETMVREGSLGVGLGMVGAYSDEKTEASIKKAADDTATDGVRRAVAAGLTAQPRTANRQEDIASAIMAVAGDIEADVIVLGTRGLGAVKSLMVGSVTHGVLHHADRPVLVIPSSRLAGRRRQALDQAALTAPAT
jgi:nucleotide-binding universal stress UspA family protein